MRGDLNILKAELLYEKLFYKFLALRLEIFRFFMNILLKPD
jgi:hypothetical protein